MQTTIITYCKGYIQTHSSLNYLYWLAVSDNARCQQSPCLQLPTAGLAWQYHHRLWQQSVPARYQYSATVSSTSSLEFLQHYILSLNTIALNPNRKTALRDSQLINYRACVYIYIYIYISEAKLKQNSYCFYRSILPDTAHNTAICTMCNTTTLLDNWELHSTQNYSDCILTSKYRGTIRTFCRCDVSLQDEGKLW